MTDLRDDMAIRDEHGPDEHGRPEPQRRPGSPYEHPALEPEQGYWAGRWAEFKRLWSLSWNNGYNKPVIIGSALVFLALFIESWISSWI